MLGLRAQAASAITKLVQVRSGRFRVGANDSTSINLPPRRTQEFLRRYPGIQIELECDRSPRLLSELKDRHIDVALVSFMPDEATLESQFMMRDELVLIASPDHPFAERRQILLEDLAEQFVIVMDAACVWHKKLVDSFVRSNAPLNLTVDNAPIETVKRMVALGLGVGFVPRMCVCDEVAQGELSDCGTRRPARRAIPLPCSQARKSLERGSGFCSQPGVRSLWQSRTLGNGWEWIAGH